MFLDCDVLQMKGAIWRSGLFILLAQWFGVHSFSYEIELPCFVDLPVYDARGNRLAFNIVSAKQLEPPENVRSLGRDIHIPENGSRLTFSKRALQSGFEITLKGPDNRQIKRQVELVACRQRTSLQFGELDSGGDAAGSTILGRITKCRLQGDWWVRVMPMFGADWGNRPHGPPVCHDGHVRLTDGSFVITGAMRGERHILVVGRGRDTVKVVGIDVVAGGQNPLGDIDLTDACPK